MTLPLGPDELLTTTRAVRKRLDFSRPVERAVIEECLEIALQAPTGGNRQSWHWVIVTDAEKKRAIGEWYRQSWYAYNAAGRPSYREDDPRRAQQPRVISSARYLADRMGEVPVMVIPCYEGRVDAAGINNAAIAGLYGSILPAAWSFMLAARARGLGTAWTTLHLAHEDEVAAVLGLPDDVRTAVLIPTAYYTGETFRPAARGPVDDVLHVDNW
jgi:nitroreductase